MTLSLNEVEALAKKATRGAGYPWGIAEETGKAVRWLCAADVDGGAALADLLAGCDGADLSDRAPVLGEDWTSRGNSLCPLLAGAALSDLADTLEGAVLRLQDVARPILLAPFAGLSARCLEKSVCLEWANAHVTTDGQTLALTGNIGAASATVTLRISAGAARGARQPTCSRANTNDDALAVLNRLAHRTYAPATEASRHSGAGAGLSDND